MGLDFQLTWTGDGVGWFSWPAGAGAGGAMRLPGPQGVLSRCGMWYQGVPNPLLSTGDDPL